MSQLTEPREAPTVRRFAAVTPTGGFQVLVVTEHQVTVFPIPASGEVVIGRSEDADIKLDDPAVSRRHAALRHRPELALIDLGSVNGTRLDGRLLEPGDAALVTVGSAIALGDCLLTIRAASASPPAAEALAPESVSSAIEQLRPSVEKIAAGTISVLIQGETGVGKEVLARMLHRLSPRASEPMLCLNCASFNESLLEGELFGYERGAFTGAHQSKPGLLEQAHGGTIFLDEIGEMSSAMQAKLLRAIEQQEVTRLGSVKTRTLDVRFIAATNRDLELEISDGRFRADLYFRLNGALLELPPLRERTGEIRQLAAEFVRGFSADLKRAPVDLSPEALSLLEGYAWPGNVRELRNVMQRAVLLSSGDRISLAHLPVERLSRPWELTTSSPLPARQPSSPPTRSSSQSVTLRPPPAPEDLLAALEGGDERGRIIQALDAHAGNQTRAAKKLGISRRTLIDRIERYGIARPRKPTE